MNKKIMFVLVIGVLAVLGSTSVLAKTNETGKRFSEQHKEQIGKIVQELLRAADGDKQIGDEVRVIAQEEKDKIDSIKAKMDRIEERNRFKVFLIGSDYKNLGDLRSDLVTSQNHLDRLNRALERTTSSTLKVDLEIQIKELQTVKDRAEAFAKINEEKFSLLGWLVKMFSGEKK